ncbi:Uncharacterized conserved protein, DUF1697 family [Kaistella treverensis]|uniref:Uncharacterized conserved protein, DUF1697 family n=1 Tax=Kaistella treverensis TaxID=631455 RepID=A0A1I3JZV9_9FLAO|nr:DUF1697 domain-containing protein [Kaistella treverensis]SFI65807.1 Uncharacterized conserved protein, DUF1697 family [Kaistella treverensis]
MKYCAFLRGINVNGTRMKMAEVCEVFRNVGMMQVSSVLATGNILFSSEKTETELKTTLEKELSSHFNYEAFLFLKTENEVKEILEKNPFEATNNFHNYVFITAENTASLLKEKFETCQKSEGEKGILIDDDFYWQVEKGNTLDSDFGKILGNKNFKEKLTSRNINTLEKIALKF